MRLTLTGKASDMSETLIIAHDSNSSMPLADRLEMALARVETGLAARDAATALLAARHAALKAAAAEAVVALDAIVGDS